MTDYFAVAAAITRRHAAKLLAQTEPAHECRRGHGLRMPALLPQHRADGVSVHLRTPWGPLMTLLEQATKHQKPIRVDTRHPGREDQ